jgi:hypothetical protein
MAVTVLEEGGRPKSGWDNAFFAAHQNRRLFKKSLCLKEQEEALLVGTSTEEWDTAPIAEQHVHLQ